MLCSAWKCHDKRYVSFAVTFVIFLYLVCWIWGMTTCALRQCVPLYLAPWPTAFRLGSSPALSENPPNIAQPPYSSVLNATTQGAFLPSLFSLSSQCRFAVSRGVVVERRKQEEINREGQKAGRQTRYRAGESSKTFSTFDKSTRSNPRD